MAERRFDESRLTEHELVIAGYRYALSLTHHEHDAEDLVQQACLKIFRVQRRIKDKAYLIKMARQENFLSLIAGLLSTFQGDHASHFVNGYFI